jgi:hypothetical protein
MFNTKINKTSSSIGVRTLAISTKNEANPKRQTSRKTISFIHFNIMVIHLKTGITFIAPTVIFGILAIMFLANSKEIKIINN